MKRSIRILLGVAIGLIVIACIGVNEHSTLKAERAEKEETIIVEFDENLFKPSFLFLEELKMETPISTLNHEEEQSTIGFTPLEDIPLPGELQLFLYERCSEEDVPFELALSIISGESSFRTGVVGGPNNNGTYDYGLFQINGSNLKWASDLVGRELSLNDLLDPYINIEVGVKIFSYYHSAWDDYDLTEEQQIHYALNSYNMGIGGFNKAGRPETRNYSTRIVEKAKELENDN